MNNNINIEEYLQNKGIRIIRNEGKEIVIHCLFSNCDQDSRGSEAHMYVERSTGRYHCKKCDASGNYITLRKHFGDITPRTVSQVRNRNFTQGLVEECVINMPPRIREYLNSRAVSDEIIEKYKIGYGEFYGKNWITIPMRKEGELEYSFFYLRKDPEDKSDMPKNLSYPKGKGETLLFGEYANQDEYLIITEGIMDCLSLLSAGVKAVTSTGGCMTFKEEWVSERLLKAKSIYVAYDRDEPGDMGSEKVLKMLREAKHKNLYRVALPEEVGEKGDVNDYLSKLKLPISDLYTKYAEPYPKQIDVRQFKEMTLNDVSDVLSKTIVGDETVKLITFICQLSAFTKDSQFNVMFNAPSSTGKSYTALEVSKLFPNDSLIKLGNCSATAFFHDSGKFEKETNTITVDLSNKILIFTENQHYQLLEKLRAFLSHDEKIMHMKITDKNQKGGNKTKNIELIGYASVIFCTATLKADTQEKTRFLILSPEISDSKISGGINKVIERGSRGDKYDDGLSKDQDRSSLKLRIQAIKDLEIDNIYIKDEDEAYLKEKYYGRIKRLQARHQRDINRIISIIKTIALLNVWYRELNNKNIYVSRNDIDNALSLYSNIAENQDLGISSYLYQIYKEVIRQCYFDKVDNDIDIDEGMSYQDILNYHHKVKGFKMDHSYLRQNVIPELEACGLIEKVYIGNKVKLLLTDNIREFISDGVGGVKLEN